MEKKSRTWSARRFNDYSSVDKQLYDEEAE